MRLLSFLLSNLGKKRRAADGDKKNNAAASGRSKAAVPCDKKAKRWSWASLRIRRGRLAKRGNGDGVADETRAVDGKGVKENHGSTGTGVPEMGMGDESTAPTSARESAHETRDKKQRTDETVDVEIGVDADVKPRNNGRNHSIAPAHALAPALVSTFPLLPARA